MKFGYLEFRYGKRTGGPQESASLSINIGDNIQSLAVRNLFHRIGIPESEVVGVDRDDLPGYRGGPVRLLMNGCFYQRCFPLPETITPVFFGFNTASDGLVRDQRAMLKKHEPIGCRDAATQELLTRHGIAAYVSGCATLTLDRRESTPREGVAIISHGSGAGEFPGALLEHIPPGLLAGAGFVFQRSQANGAPLDDAAVAQADSMARSYLEKYRSSASLIITPLLHVASPCLALGIPVVLARKAMDDRFTSINRLIPVYTPETFKAIDWSPAVVPLEEVKRTMADCVRVLLDLGKPEPSMIGRFTALYAASQLKPPFPPVPSGPAKRTWPWQRR